MDLFEKILDILKHGIKGPYDFILLIVLLIALLYWVFVWLNKIKSYSDFDRLFFPKNERSLQEKLVTILDYFFVLIFYLIYGAILALIFTFIRSNFIQELITIIIFSSFAVSLLPIISKRTFLDKIQQKKSNKYKWLKVINTDKFRSLIFYINFSSSIFIYSIFISISLNQITKHKYSFTLVLFLLPWLLMYQYRSFNKKYGQEYTCKIITEKEFNDSKLVVQYSLDKDRMVFRKPDDIVKNTIYMYDRSTGKYFKFIRVNFL